MKTSWQWVAWHTVRNSKKKAKRLAEFQEKRGFKSNNIEEQGMMRREDWAEGGLVSKRQSKREEKVTRAALIPTSVQVNIRIYRVIFLTGPPLKSLSVRRFSEKS